MPRVLDSASIPVNKLPGGAGLFPGTGMSRALRTFDRLREFERICTASTMFRKVASTWTTLADEDQVRHCQRAQDYKIPFAAVCSTASSAFKSKSEFKYVSESESEIARETSYAE